MEDSTLVRNVLAGDMQSFRLLIQRHERLVAHMVGRLVKKNEEKEELCQDIFLKVHEKLAEFSFQSKLSTWIGTIAYRHAINHLRKNKIAYSELPDEEGLTRHFVEMENPESVLENQDMDSFVLKMIDELPAAYRIVINLYHVEGMTYPEICQVTKMPEGTVKNYLFRARNLLKEKVKKYIGKEELL